MSKNKELLKNKIIYRASYRGTKEMDILMLSFVNSVINHISIDELIKLDKLINMDDEILISLKKKESLYKDKFPDLENLIEKFKKYKI